MCCVRQTKLESIDHRIPIGRHAGAARAGAHHAEPSKLMRKRACTGNEPLLITWLDQ
jgi:hypothetical protein